MADIKNLERVVAFLRNKAAEMSKDTLVSAVVGYTASYALYVHENLEMKWAGIQRDPRKRDIGGLGGPLLYHQDNPRSRDYNPHGRYWDPQGRGKSKFLEDPARKNRTEIFKIVRDAFAKGKTMAQSLLLGALFLQRKSQEEVPVDTGTLRASAFTRLEK